MADEEKTLDDLTPVEKTDLAKVYDSDKLVDVSKSVTTEAITEKKNVDKGLGFTRPTEVVHENAKEGVRVREVIEYMNPPDHPGWAAERGRKFIVEKL